jgi:hypothetical protein
MMMKLLWTSHKWPSSNELSQEDKNGILAPLTGDEVVDDVVDDDDDVDDDDGDDDEDEDEMIIIR